MAVFRGYDLPGNPFARPRWTFVDPDGAEYSDEYKAICEDGAKDREPSVTSGTCPRCLRFAQFLLEVSYDANSGGAIRSRCSLEGCGLAHLAVQCGPPEDQLLRIEEQRTRDQAGKGELGRQSEHDGDTGEERQGDAARERERDANPERECEAAQRRERDAIQELGRDAAQERELEMEHDRARRARVATRMAESGRALERARASEQVMQERENRPGRPRVHARGLVGIANLVNIAKPAGRRRGGGRGRRIKVILWAKVNAMPVTKSVTIQDPEKISKSELSWVVKEYPRGSDIHIEHWIFSYGQWKTLMAEDSGIQVGINQDRIFLKMFGMQCTGLGHELRLYEGVQSWGARSARDGGPTLSDLLAQRRRGVQFIALWVKDMKGPTILQSPRTVENGRVVSKWVDPPELRTKMGAVIWMEAESKWQPYEGNSGARVPMPLKTPVILLRHPDVVGLMGLGEVLDYLENERAIQNAVGGDDEDEVVSIPVVAKRPYVQIHDADGEADDQDAVADGSAKGQGLAGGAGMANKGKQRAEPGSPTVQTSALRIAGGSSVRDAIVIADDSGSVIHEAGSASTRGTGKTTRYVARIGTQAEASGSGIGGNMVAGPSMDKGKHRQLAWREELTVIEEEGKEVIDVSEG
ncbi:hypothetical protein VTO73DRAFT_12986 [Trametes versicolor]